MLEVSAVCIRRICRRKVEIVNLCVGDNALFDAVRVVMLRKMPQKVACDSLIKNRI